MTTDGVPTERAQRAASPRRRAKRHPAGASRILAAGVATASTFGLVAMLGAQPSAGDASTTGDAQIDAAAPVTTVVPTTAPAPVVVVRRSYVQVDGGTPPATSPTPAPSASRAPAPVTATPRRSAPVTRSSSS